MVDFLEMRRNMVESQVLPDRVTSQEVVNAILDTPREQFVPRQLQHIAYMDNEFTFSYDRFMLRPSTFAKMLQALNPQHHEKALHVGCNLGYGIAVLSQLVHETVGVEAEEILSRQAEVALETAGIKKFEVILGAHEKGCPGSGPYDVILVEGKIFDHPQTLLDQLAEDGRLVTIMACPDLADEVTLYTKVNGHISKRPVCDATSPALKGFELEEKFVF